MLLWGSEIHITSTRGNSPGEPIGEKQKSFSEIKVVFLFHCSYNLFFLMQALSFQYSNDKLAFDLDRLFQQTNALHSYTWYT